MTDAFDGEDERPDITDRAVVLDTAMIRNVEAAEDNLEGALPPVLVVPGTVTQLREGVRYGHSDVDPVLGREYVTGASIEADGTLSDPHRERMVEKQMPVVVEYVHPDALSEEVRREIADEKLDDWLDLNDTFGDAPRLGEADAAPTTLQFEEGADMPTVSKTETASILVADAGGLPAFAGSLAVKQECRELGVVSGGLTAFSIAAARDGADSSDVRRVLRRKAEDVPTSLVADLVEVTEGFDAESLTEALPGAAERHRKAWKLRDFGVDDDRIDEIDLDEPFEVATARATHLDEDAARNAGFRQTAVEEEADRIADSIRSTADETECLGVGQWGEESLTERIWSVVSTTADDGGAGRGDRVQ